MRKDYEFISEKKYNLKKIVISIFIILIDFYLGVTLVEKSDYKLSFLVIQMIVAYYFVIAVHEFGHVIIAKINRCKLRILIVGPLIFIKCNNGWKIKFKITPMILGGLTIPNLSKTINSENDYKIFKNIFSEISVGGILANIIFLLIILVILKYSLYGDLLIMMLVFNINCIILAFYPKGDIDLINIIKKENDIIKLFLLQELRYEKNANHFIKGMCVNYVSNKLIEREFSLQLIDAIGIFLMNKDLYKNDEFIIVHEFVNWFINNYNEIKSNKTMVEKLKFREFIGIINEQFELENKIVNFDIGREGIRYINPLVDVYHKSVI